MSQAKKGIVAIFIISFLIVAFAATTPPPEPVNKNLKILPKNISHEDLDKVMDEFKTSLGVKCNFCHAPSRDTASHHLDFASDEKSEKKIARDMMKMTANINKKFFSYNKDEKGASVKPITCMTCHRGTENPSAK